MTQRSFAVFMLTTALTFGALGQPAFGAGTFPPPTDPTPTPPTEPEPTPEPEPEPEPTPPPEPEPPIGGGGDDPIDENFDIPNDRVGVSPAPLNVVSRVPPNVLLILDNSESGQEGLDGRVAIGEEDGDRENLEACQPDTFNAENCPAGARSPLSKSSTMKRVGLQIIKDYRTSINLGLMAYQQNPASTDRNSFNSGNTVAWRLTERAVDVRYSLQSNPSWYNPDFDGAWNATTKRYRTRLPNSDFYAFFNVGVPGYFIVDRDLRDLPGPSDDRTEYWRTNAYPTSRQDHSIDRYQELTTDSHRRVCGVFTCRDEQRPSAPVSLYYTNPVGSWGSEPPRLYRRLHILRGWSYELTKTIFPRSPGASCSISP